MLQFGLCFSGLFSIHHKKPEQNISFKSKATVLATLKYYTVCKPQCSF